MFKKVAFTMYPVTDMPRARKFYEETLGIKVSKISSQGAWVEYDLPGGGCFCITTFVDDAPSDMAGGTIAFEVDELERLVDDLKKKGVAFKTDMIHSPVCKMVVCLDPEGNSLLLHQLTPK